ncbi:hypothetical protein [Flavobacterium sp. AED]|uniref:hypothetical protein n=1 Tax=Flavobacterium sp. AED TaxID=1423323 RepID=UPI0005807705|nr:hypothetical protein [Flavobacterium sp. AED]KIA84011.1 hypothetical protein OA85_14695 [Flavobacterium sp. AED]
MKKIPIVFLSVMLLAVQFIAAQTIIQDSVSSKKDKTIYLESGINLSIPVHIEMYRSHRFEIGINIRAWKKVSPKWDLGIKVDYDYWLVKQNLPKITPESTLTEKTLYSNFNIFSIKINTQYSFSHKWYWGAESGAGYALSDADKKFGLGFVSEYGGGAQQFGLSSAFYLGRYFIIGNAKNKLGLSMDFTQFLAHGHAENSLGLKLKYRFIH